MIGDIFQPTHLLFILVIALVVLGPKRLPEVSRSLGRGIRDFRVALTGDDRDASRESLHRVEYVPPAPAEYAQAVTPQAPAEYAQAVTPQAPAEYAQAVTPQAPVEYVPPAPAEYAQPVAPQPPAASAQPSAPGDAPEWLFAAAPNAPAETDANVSHETAAVSGQEPVEPRG